MAGAPAEIPSERRRPVALNVSGLRVNSSPELLPSSPRLMLQDDETLEAVAAGAKALLRQVEKLTESTNRSPMDRPRTGRLVRILVVVDEIRVRLESRMPSTPARDENQRLRRELSASNAARKSLEKMFSSLGKEKEIMAGELARKAHELSEMEEILADLKAQNEKLLAKVQVLTTYSGDRRPSSVGDVSSAGRTAALQERNKVLSDQLLKSIEGYRSVKRKLKEAQEANTVLVARVSGFEQIRSRISRFRELLQPRDGCSGDSGHIDEVLNAIERICSRKPDRQEGRKQEDEDGKVGKSSPTLLE